MLKINGFSLLLGFRLAIVLSLKSNLSIYYSFTFKSRFAFHL